MSYYSDYEGHKPFTCTSDNDDVPMISRERHIQSVRYARHGCYQDNRSKSYQSRLWNKEPSVTEEIEQPKISNHERLLKEAIEQTERQSRELDEIFDWNIESNHERAYDTFTNATEHVDDVKAIKYNDYYFNVDIADSSNFVFQDDSKDETDEEEEEDKFINYPHETSQAVLQDLHTLKPELTKDSDLEDLDDEDSDVEEEELESDEEKLVEEVEEISVIPIFEAASVPVEPSALNEELENEVEGIEKKLEEAYNTNHANEQTIVLKYRIPPKIDYLSLDEELQVLLGFDDEDLNKLKNSKDGMMTEDELLEIMGLKVEEPHPLDEELGNLREDDMLRTKNSLEASLTDLKPNTLPCEREFVLVKEPKPPDSFLPVSKDLALLKDIDGLKIDMDRGIWSRLAPNMGITTHIGSDIYGLLDDPGEIEIAISFSLVMASGGFSQVHWGIILLIDKPLENKWRLDVHVTILTGEII